MLLSLFWLLLSLDLLLSPELLSSARRTGVAIRATRAAKASVRFTVLILVFFIVVFSLLFRFLFLRLGFQSTLSLKQPPCQLFETQFINHLRQHRK